MADGVGDPRSQRPLLVRVGDDYVVFSEPVRRIDRYVNGADLHLPSV